MKKGIITGYTAKNCWLYKYIGYEVKYDPLNIIINGKIHRNINYVERGYVKPEKQG